MSATAVLLHHGRNVTPPCRGRPWPRTRGGSVAGDTGRPRGGVAGGPWPAGGGSGVDVEVHAEQDQDPEEDGQQRARDAAEQALVDVAAVPGDEDADDDVDEADQADVGPVTGRHAGVSSRVGGLTIGRSPRVPRENTGGIRGRPQAIFSAPPKLVCSAGRESGHFPGMEMRTTVGSRPSGSPAYSAVRGTTSSSCL